MNAARRKCGRGEPGATREISSRQEREEKKKRKEKELGKRT